MRRMLTDKLTKSIKEVVNAYNEGEFSAVTANPETTTETLTGIEINGTGYAVAGGGSTYTAGTGIDITNDEISVDNTVVTTNTDQTIDCDKTIVRRYTPQSSAQYKYNFAPPRSSISSGIWEFTVPNRLYNSNNSYYAAADSEGIVDIKDLVPAEVTGTNDGTNWTSLTVGNDTYAIPQGGSVDIDNKTIIQNLDGELETAIGGWKEEEAIQAGDFTLSSSGGSDWDLIDVDYAGSPIKTLYDALQTNTKYDVTLTFTGTTVPTTIKEAYIETNLKTSDRFGGNGALKIIDANDGLHEWEFYMEDGSYYWQVHIWPSDNWVNPSVGSSVDIDFGTITKITYHKIDSNYIEELKLNNMGGLEFNNNKELKIKTYNGGQINDFINLQLSTNGIEAQFKCNNNQFIKNKDNKFSSVLNYGVVRSILIDQTLLTQSGDHYISSQNDILEILIKAQMAEIKRNNISPDGYYGMGLNGHTISLKTLNGLSTAYPNTFFEVYWDSSTNLVTVSVNDTNSLLATFTYDHTTEVISNESIYVGVGKYNDIIQNYPYFYVEPNIYELDDLLEAETIDPRFLPGFNVAPTAAGTYTLQATVDAQGNVTYAWVTVTP